MRKLFIILSFIAFTCQGQNITVVMPDGSHYTYIKQQKSPLDPPTWVADYGNNSQTSTEDTIIIPDALKFNTGGYVGFKTIGVLKAIQDALNYTSIQMGGQVMYLGANASNGSVYNTISAPNMSFLWTFNDNFRYQLNQTGFHPNQYTSETDQSLGSTYFHWHGLYLDKYVYMYNLPAISGAKMLSIDNNGHVGTMPIPAGQGGSPNTNLDTIHCQQGIIVWYETGTTNKEVMVSFENVTTDFVSFNYPIPFNRFTKYGDNNVVNNNDISPSNNYFKAEHLTNFTGILFLKGY